MCEKVAEMNQKHTAMVIDVKSEGIYEADGLITDEKNLALCVRVADCYPVFLFSEDEKIKGVLHAGWRGVYRGIIENGVKLFKKFTQKRIFYAVGPGICGKCYEVGKEFLDYFKDYPYVFEKKKNKLFLHLLKLIEEKMKRLGVVRYKVLKLCTFENKDFYSSRRGDREKRNICVILHKKSE